MPLLWRDFEILREDDDRRIWKFIGGVFGDTEKLSRIRSAVVENKGCLAGLHGDPFHCNSDKQEIQSTFD